MQVTSTGRRHFARLTRSALAAGLLAAGIVPSQSHGQAAGVVRPSARAKVPPFSSVYVATGTLLLDVSKLNPHFERLDLPANERPGYFTLSDDAYVVGLGGYGVVLDRVTLGGEFNMADLGEESSPSGKTNRITTSHWMGTAGYALYSGWKLSIIPQLGIGLGSLKLTLRDRNGGPSAEGIQSPTFDEIVEAPGSKSTMTGSYVLVQPGVAVDYIVLRETSSSMGITIGIRFASAISPNRTTWKFNGGDVFGGPDVGPAGGVIRVVAGVGGFRLAQRR